MDRIDYLGFVRNTLSGVIELTRNAFIDAMLHHADRDRLARLLVELETPDRLEWRRAVLGLCATTPLGGEDFVAECEGWRKFHSLSYTDAAAIVRRYGVDVATMAMENGDARFPFEELPTSIKGEI